MKPRECPRCHGWMNEDEDGAWCDKCGYEIVKLSTRVGKEN